MYKLLMGAAALLLCLLSSALAQAPEQPARVILFQIDSLLYDAPERLGLDNWQHLARAGTRVEEAVTIIPWHPTTSGYFPLSTTSLPNPTLHAGSLFLSEATGQRYIQDSFAEGYTAFVAGSTAYRSVSDGFSFTAMGGSDDTVVQTALAQVRENDDLRFMRVILQDTNAVLQEVGFTDADVPWARNAYGEGSPYAASVQRADALLGEFVAQLRQLGKWRDTLLVLHTDGASRVGWHAPQAEDSWRLPLAFVGPGVAQGRIIPYAENIDIAPTIAALAGVAVPSENGASGRVLREAFAAFSGEAPDAPRHVLRLNRQIKEHLRLTGWMQVHAAAYPRLDLSLMAASNSYSTDAQFWGLDRIDEWPQAGSLDEMLQDNEEALTYLREALEASGAPPLPEPSSPSY